MKKLILISVLCLTMFAAYPAMVVLRWNPEAAPQVNDSPPIFIKMYYGGQLRTYTNSVTAPITNFVATPYVGYDQYRCVFVTLSNYVQIPIYGLKLSNQIYTAYSFINARGEESPLINEATCGFTITNKNDKPMPPLALKVSP